MPSSMLLAGAVRPHRPSPHGPADHVSRTGRVAPTRVDRLDRVLPALDALHHRLVARAVAIVAPPRHLIGVTVTVALPMPPQVSPGTTLLEDPLLLPLAVRDSRSVRCRSRAARARAEGAAYARWRRCRAFAALVEEHVARFDRALVRSSRAVPPSSQQRRVAERQVSAAVGE